MRLFKRTLVLLAVAMCIATSATGKDTMKKAYIYGVATSFNDSVVYLTEIQEVDSAWFAGKHNMLVSRENYSYQLRDHLGDKGEQHATCAVTFGLKKKSVVKKWNTLYAKYANTKGSGKKGKKAKKQSDTKAGCIVKHIPASEFQFKAVAPMSMEEEAVDQPKDKKNKKGKKNKADRNDKPQGAPPAGAPAGGAPGNFGGSAPNRMAPR